MLDDVAEGVVALAGYDGAARIDPGGDVAVAVIGGEVGQDAGACEIFHHDEATYATGSLQAAAEVHAPGHSLGRCGAVVLEFHVPAVGEEPGGGGDSADCLAAAGAASEGIVLIGGTVSCSVGGADELVVDVPGEDTRRQTGRRRRFDGGGELVAVVIVGGVHDVSADGGVFVDAVDGSVVGGGAVGDGGAAVSSGIVGPALGGSEAAVGGGADLAGVVVAVGFGVAVAGDGVTASIWGENVARGV